MKKLLFMLTAVCTVGLAHAQSSTYYSVSLQARNGAGAVISGGKDTTASGADTSYLVYSPCCLFDFHFLLTNTKISGTVAGTAFFEGTDDDVSSASAFLNANWIALNNNGSNAIATGQYADTATLGNATAKAHWFYTGTAIHRFRTYRLRLKYTNGVSAPTGVAQVTKLN